MRNFTDKEKAFLKEIVGYKKCNDVESLRLTRIFSSKFPGYIIKWRITHEFENMTLFLPNETSEQKDKIFWEIVDLCLLLMELKELGLVSFRKVNKSSSRSQMIFDYSLYTLHNDEFYYSYDTSIKVDKGESLSYPIGVSSFLSENYSSVIYPLPSLTDFVDKNFKTSEEIRYNRQLIFTIISVCIAGLGVIISAILGYCQLTYDHNENIRCIQDVEYIEEVVAKDVIEDTVKLTDQICSDSLKLQK